MDRIRVLVVEDSLTVRRRLLDILAADAQIEVVGEAGDGIQAIEICRDARPDVVTMDMMLPLMTGLAATEYIMAQCPTPILVVSSSVNRGELFRTYDALAAGAVDVLEKPTGRDPDGVWENKFLATVKLVARIRVITHPRGRLRMFGYPAPEAPPPAHPATCGRRCELVAIGASTGGPGAIVEVLRALPASFRLPVLFVLHIADPFGAAFADWLDAQSPRQVVIANDGDSIAALAGRVVMAPADRHLVARNGRLRLTRDPERHSCRPSVDALFESVADDYGASAAGCLLTGMGRDGALGLLKIRQAGGATIAQDESTSVVYGMPREAAALGGACQVLRLDEIGPALAALAEPAAVGAEARR
jgi:two-component system, chemotaxis family, protein-glutamate methylesterase/glutaminase